MTTRQYMPSLGRFTTPDVLFGEVSDPQSLNLWAYAVGNPVTHSDPSGLCVMGPDGGCYQPWVNGDRGEYHPMTTGGGWDQPSYTNPCGGVSAWINASCALPDLSPLCFDCEGADRWDLPGRLITDPPVELVCLDIVTMSGGISIACPPGGMIGGWDPEPGGGLFGGGFGQPGGLFGCDGLFAFSSSCGPDTPGTDVLYDTEGVGATPAPGDLDERVRGARSKLPKEVPPGWTVRVADNGKGIVFQPPGAKGNADMIRVMDPTPEYPEGYIRIYNHDGQPVDPMGPPASEPETHIPVGYPGPWLYWLGGLL